MRRLTMSMGAAIALTLVIAGTAFGAHCVNESKAADAGQHVDVIINVATGAVSFEGLNANGRPRGGFADVWLDFDGDGTGDQLACDDVFLVSNHSPGGPSTGQTEDPLGPAVLPPIIRTSDPGGEGAGIGDCASL